jgi:hypothetical protein
MFENGSEIDHPPSKPDLMDDLLSKTSSEIKAIALEYAHLASQPNLLPQQADRLGEILTIAVENNILSFWLAEIDHILGHYLNILDDAARRSYEDQQALLREHRGEDMPTSLISPVSFPLATSNCHSGKITSIDDEYPIEEVKLQQVLSLSKEQMQLLARYSYSRN